MAQFAVIGIDMTAALKIAEALCVDPISVSELLPSCESGMVVALNKRMLDYPRNT